MRIARCIISAAVFLVFVFGLYGFGGYLYFFLKDVEIGPLFLRLLAEASLTAVLLLAMVFLTTLIFGRWYCSSLCPLGTFQDIVIGIRGFFRPYKNKNKPSSVWRYIIFSVIFLSLFAGFILPLSMLDPFSIFTRGITGFDSPIALEPFVITSLVLLLVVFLVIWRGRLFCNLFCPVGSMLGAVSRHSFMGIRLKDNCKKCGACEKICKAEAIDFKNKTVDYSKCVLCFNCLTACKFDAITYAKLPNLNQERRKLLKTGLGLGIFGLGAFLSNIFIFGKHPKPASKELLPHPLPPGARSLDHLKKQCISCHACVKSCPVDIIKIKNAVPELEFENSFCQFDCTDCSRSCPSSALSPLTEEEKKTRKIGEAELQLDLCVVVTKKEACGACAEHCPTGAVSMVLNADNIPEPVLDKSLCIGCGACMFACPVRPERAINVFGLAYPQTARVLDKKSNNIIVDDGEDFAF